MRAPVPVLNRLPVSVTSMEPFLAALRKYAPIKADDGEAYMRFGCGRLGFFWFAVGRDTESVREHQYAQMLPRFARDVMWC